MNCKQNGEYMTSKNHNVRFPAEDEIQDLLDDAIPLAKKNAKRNQMELEPWMIADAVCKVCPELAECDQAELEELIESVCEQRTDALTEESSSIEVMRATELWQQTGAFSVRIQGMGRQHRISLRDEFDEHDGAGSKYIVLLDDQYPVATCRFYELSADCVMIGRVVVLPEYRGKGLGGKTIVEAECWIHELGYSMIRLESRVEMVGFYEKLGYRKESDEVIHGITFDCIPMNKLL